MRRIALALSTLALLSACGRGTASTDGVLVVATPWPLQWLAEQVAPEAEVSGIGEAGQDPHELDLRPAERELLDRADAILYLGELGFQPQVEDAAAARADVAVAVNEAAEDLLHDAAEEGHESEDEDQDGHEHGTVDPHLWFDPRVLAAAAPALAERLAEVDPSRAEAYRSRAGDVAEELDALHAELDTLLRDCRQSAAVVGHEAFGYLLHPRGLEQIGVSGTGGHSETSPGRLAELSGLIQERGIRVVLTEAVEGREAAESLAREAGVELREIDTLESPSDAARARGYVALLREQAEVFAEALECGA